MPHFYTLYLNITDLLTYFCVILQTYYLDTLLRDTLKENNYLIRQLPNEKTSEQVCLFGQTHQY